jgi:nicotinamidase-related amidase
MSIRELLNPGNCSLLLIDYQQTMALGVHSVDCRVLKHNALALATAAKTFNLPTTYTALDDGEQCGAFWPDLLNVFPDLTPIRRSSLNCWESRTLVEAIEDTRRKKLLVAGLWTDVGVNFPVITALAEGFEVYVVADACGSITQEAHDLSVQRMTQAGAVPVNWRQVLLELQRDWARKDTYDAVMKLVWNREPGKVS